jgi:hypothetical protein
MLPSYLSLKLVSQLTSLQLTPNKTMCAFLTCLARAKLPAHLILRDLIVLTI